MKKIIVLLCLLWLPVTCFAGELKDAMIKDIMDYAVKETDSKYEQELKEITADDILTINRLMLSDSIIMQGIARSIAKKELKINNEAIDLLQEQMDAFKEYKKWKDKQPSQATKAVNFIFKTGLCIWGFQQKNSYGNFTGVLFGLAAGIQFYELAF